MKIDGKYFEQIKTLGKGAYGKVIKVRDASGKYFAIKKVNYSEKDGVYADIIKEMDILRRLSHHPNLISLCGYKWSEDYFYMWMDYGGVALYKYIYDTDVKTRMRHLSSILHQMISAIGYLHENNITHRDLKPDNILLTTYNNTCQVKICDFGLSKAMILRRNTPKTSTLWYRAPENLQALKVYDNKIDIWPIGCIIYEYIHQQVLFKGNNSKDTMMIILCMLGPVSDRTYDRLNIDKHKFVRRWRKKHMLPVNHDYLSNLMFKCLQLHPDDRPNIYELLNHSYFQQYNLPLKPVPNVKEYTALYEDIPLQFRKNMNVKAINDQLNEHLFESHSKSLESSSESDDSEEIEGCKKCRKPCVEIQLNI